MDKSVYFIGIGGIGMSAIARYYNHLGYSVSGYDKTPSPLTSALEREGIEVHFEPDMGKIPQDRNNALVIYTPAIPEEMEELKYLVENGYRVIKRSEALGEITRGHTTLAVAGTHGKTTTTTLLAHLLQSSGIGCSAFLGGISKNYGSNLILNRNNTIVVEADEFDRSFLRLHPRMAVITSMDADHLDIYSDIEHVREAFIQFGSQCSEALIVRKGLEQYFGKGVTGAKVYSYSYCDGGDFYADEVRLLNGGRLSFTLHLLDKEIKECILGIPGKINIENAVAASAIAFLNGAAPDEIKRGMLSYKGVNRRFDLRAEYDGHIYIDDYAHHPKEISAALESIRELFPGKDLTVIFQPHLYSRTRDFHEEFAKSLSMADSLILLPIYPAREEPIEGITSEIILERVTCREKKIVSKEELIEEIASRERDILMTVGAGDIERSVPLIEEFYRDKYAEKGNDI